MRIGFFNSSLPEADRKPGGVDVHLHRLANHLGARGHQLTFFSYSPAPDDAEYKVIRLHPRRFAQSVAWRLTLVPANLNRLDTSGLDVLHLHGDDWFYWRRRLPTVRTFYGSALDEARGAARLRRRVTQYATFGLEILASRLATSSYTLIPDVASPYGARGHLPCGVDVSAASSWKRHGPPVILFVGTWSGRKRGELLHRAFVEHIRPRIPGAQLQMVSDRCVPAPGVRWFRRPSDEELSQLYRRASVFCLPSSYEGFGIPYIEAMAHGTPVVATPNPGAEFVLEHGRSGVITGEEHLGQRLVEVIQDGPLRRRLADAGKRRVEAFAWPQVAEAHEAAYRQAIEHFGNAKNGLSAQARLGSASS